MSILLSLPEAVSVDFLSTWCELSDVKKLDDSFAFSRNQNVVWEKILFSPQLIIGDIEENFQSCMVNLSWIIEQKLKARKIVFHRMMFQKWNSQFSSLADIDTSEAEWIYLDCLHFFTEWDKEYFVRLLNSAVKLKRLYITCLTHEMDDVLSRVKPEIWKSVSNLDIQKSSIYDEDLKCFPNIAHNTANLDNFFCGTQGGVVTEADFITLIQNNKKLEIIYCDGPDITNNILNALGTNCPLLDDVKLEGCTDVSLSAVTKFVSSYDIVPTGPIDPYNPTKTKDNSLISLELKHMHGHNIAVQYNTENKKEVIFSLNRDDSHFIEQELIDFFSVVKSISHLNMTYFPARTTKVIDLIVKNNQNTLEVVHFSEDSYEDSTENTVYFTQQLIKHCILFDVVVYDSCNSLNDANLLSLFSEDNNVTSLEITDNRNLTTEGYLAVLQCNSQFVNVEVDRCDNIDEAAVEEWCNGGDSENDSGSENDSEASEATEESEGEEHNGENEEGEETASGGDDA